MAGPDKTSTIRFRTLAEIGQLRQYTAAMREYRGELDQLTRVAERYQGVAGGGGGGGGGGAPGDGAGSGSPPPVGPAPGGGGQGPEGGKPPPVPPPAPGGGGGSKPGLGQRIASGAMSLGLKGAAIGAGLALGGGLLSFFTARANHFMQLSSVMAQLNRRFREGEGAVHGWGSAMAFTVGQTAQMMELMGSNVNDPTKAQFQSFAGIQRNYGLGGDAIGGLSSIEKYTHGSSPGLGVDRTGLAQIIGRAVTTGMDGGRLAEHIRTIASVSEETFRRTGKSSVTGALATTAIPGLIFGPGDERGRGQMGVEFMARLNAGADNPAMQTLLMRAMGYGQPGGPGYIGMRMQSEAGFYGEAGVQNLGYLHQEFSARGADKQYAFRALETTMPGLRAHELDKLAAFLTNPEMQPMLDKLSGVEDLDAFYGGLSQKERAAFDESGFAGMAGLAGRAGAGDWRQVQMEGLSMRYGPAMAETLMKLTDTADQTLQAFQKLTGVDWGTMLVELVSAINRLSRALNKWGDKGSLNDQYGGGLYGEIATDTKRNWDASMRGETGYGPAMAGAAQIIQVSPQGKILLMALEQAGFDGLFSDTTAGRYQEQYVGGSDGE